jgi:hypothetical protein
MSGRSNPSSVNDSMQREKHGKRGKGNPGKSTNSTFLPFSVSNYCMSIATFCECLNLMIACLRVVLIKLTVAQLLVGIERENITGIVGAPLRNKGINSSGTNIEVTVFKRESALTVRQKHNQPSILTVTDHNRDLWRSLCVLDLQPESYIIAGVLDSPINLWASPHGLRPLVHRLSYANQAAAVLRRQGACKYGHYDEAAAPVSAWLRLSTCLLPDIP